MSYTGYTYKGPRTSCRECTERYLGCHDHCETYQKALAEWLERKKDIRHKKNLIQQNDRFAIDSVIRNLKRR